MANPLDSTHAPTPFTAEEIRRGCPPGRVVVVRHRAADGREVLSSTTFLGSDAVVAEMVRRDLDPPGEPTPSSTTWLDLQRHASFPAELTTVTTETIDTPMGALDCLRYDVSHPDGVRRFWFATTLPGMPVRVSAGDEPPAMVMVSSTAPDPDS